MLLEVLFKCLILLTIQNVLKALYWTLMSHVGVVGKLDQKWIFDCIQLTAAQSFNSLQLNKSTP